MTSDAKLKDEGREAFDGGFGGFPKHTLIEKGDLPLEDIATIIINESHRPKPIYGVHRWFARRAGAEFRSILSAISLTEFEKELFWSNYSGNLNLRGATVLDPFVGGGTSLYEAKKCNSRVIGYDIDPVATFITRFELEAESLIFDFDKIDKFTNKISKEIEKFHTTNVPDKGKQEVIHHFWVESRICPDCKMEFEIHPHYRLAYDNKKGIQWVFCKKCHRVYELQLLESQIICNCGTTTTIQSGTLSRGNVTCPNCNFSSRLSERNTDKKPKWNLFAQEYFDSSDKKRYFKSIYPEDKQLYQKASDKLSLIQNDDIIPTREIPPKNRSDNRPLIHGFFRYRDLFNDRQLLHLYMLGKAISQLEDRNLQKILSIAFSEHLSTNCMYSSFAFGYRRVSPIFSIHSYRHITRPVELNPWLKGIGRGTFPNTLNKVRKAIDYAKKQSFTNNSIPTPKRRNNQKFPSNLIREGDFDIYTKSSENLNEIPDSSIDLILTDPPYFDNICYSELSDFYLAWQQSIGVAEAPFLKKDSWAPMMDNLSLKNRTIPEINNFNVKLQRIFSECNRVLKEQGLFIFTFHHKSPMAWESIARSLVNSNFICTKVIPIRGEGKGGLHSYSGTIKWDAVLVCRKHKFQNNFNKQMVVSRKAILEAKAESKLYHERFMLNRDIGFREPDMKNLEKAFLVAFSSQNCIDADIPISEALLL